MVIRAVTADADADGCSRDAVCPTPVKKHVFWFVLMII